MRLWAGAGEGSDAGADAAERARQLADAAAAVEALLGAARVVDGGVTATGVLSRQWGNLITIVSTR